MSEGFWLVRRLVKMHPDRVWTLAELVQEADLSSADVQLAVERLILHGELLRDGGDRYRRPVSGE